MSEKEKTEELVVVDVHRYKKVKNALKDSEARYRLLFENLSIGVFQITADGKIIDANPALLKMLGYSSISELARGQTENTGNGSFENWRDLCNQIERQGAGGGFDLTWKKKDHSPLFIRVSARGIAEKDGQALLYEGTIEDISERKQAEILEHALYEIARAPEMAKNLDALYQSVHRIIKGLMPADNFYVALYDEKKDLLSFPYFVDELEEPPLPRKPGKGLTEYVLRTGRALLFDTTQREEMNCREHVEEVGVPSACWLGVPLRAGDRTIGVIAIQHYSDPKAYGEREMQILDYVSGQVASTIEHKRAEEAIVWEKAFLEALVETAPVGIVIADNHGRVQRVNNEFVRMFGYNVNEVNGKVIDTLIVPAGYEEAASGSTRSTEEGKKCVFETVRKKKDDTRCDVSIISAPIHIAGRQEAVYAIYRDISEPKRADTERQALLEVMQGLVAAENLHDFLSKVHKSISKVIFAENFFVTLYDIDTSMFEEVYSVDKFDPPAPPSKLEKSISGYVFRTGQPLLLTQARFDELAALGEMKLVGTNSPSWLGVPLKTSRETIGVMVVQDYDKENRYTGRELDFLVSIAGQVALVVERKRAEELSHASLKEKEVLLQEIHHRVKNNLMSIIGLIQMQEIKAKNETLSGLLKELEGRVRVMALVHQSLYKSTDLARIDLQNYIETMVVQLRAALGPERDIRLLVQATGVKVGLDIAIPCGLIMNELITNSFKYAFPNDISCSGMRNCEIIVSMSQDDTVFILEVTDNGIGLPAGLDWEQAESLGLRLVIMLSQQLKGTMEIERAGGTTFRLRFTKPVYSEG